MAAPTVAAVGSVVSGTGATTITLPSHQADDILVLAIETADQAVSVPSGWAHVTGSPVSMATADATRLTVLWLRATSGATANPSIPKVGTHQMIVPFAIRGCPTTGDPWDTIVTSTEATSDTSGSITGGTTSVADCLVLALIASGFDAGADGTAGFSGWTNADLVSVAEQFDHQRTAGDGGCLGMAAGVKSTAGAFGATTVTLANADTKAMMAIAFKPAATTTAVGKDLDARWAVRAAVGDQLDTRWAVRALAGDTLDARWAVRAVAGDQIDTRWAVRQLAGDNLDLRWRVESLATAVGKDLDVRWAVRQAVGDTLDARWNVRAAVGDQLDARWAVRTVAADALDLRWAVRTVVADQLDTRWAVRALAGDALDLRWAVRALAGDDVDLRWAVLSFVPPVEVLGVVVGEGRDRFVIVLAVDPFAVQPGGDPYKIEEGNP